MSAEETNVPYEGPCVIELMGHRRLAGYVSEAEMFGTKLLRIDAPQPDGTTATQLYGGGAIYCITPTTEEIVERIASSVSNRVRPVQPWELPAASEPPADNEGQNHFTFDEDDLDGGDVDEGPDPEEEW